MKILFQVGLDLSRPGGVETHVLELASGLMARGHSVDLLAGPAELRPLHLIREARASHYDILHQQGSVWPRSLPLDERYVRTLHFCTAAKMSTYVRLGRMRTLANLGNWRGVVEDAATARRPGRFIAVANRVKHDYARWHGVDPARVTVISNGATFAPGRESRSGWRWHHLIEPDVPVLLTIGRADFVKGYDLLARAWHRVLEAHPKALWVTAGGARAERTPGRLITGPLARADVIEWIHAADLGAMPSYYEGCSLALLDMLAAGLFTLSHDVGNAAEVIRPGMNGVILPRDARAWAAELTRRIGALPGRAAEGLSRDYAWDSIVERTEALYREVIAGRAVERLTA